MLCACVCLCMYACVLSVCLCTYVYRHACRTQIWWLSSTIDLFFFNLFLCVPVCAHIHVCRGWKRTLAPWKLELDVAELPHMGARTMSFSEVQSCSNACDYWAGPFHLIFGVCAIHWAWGLLFWLDWLSQGSTYLISLQCWGYRHCCNAWLLSRLQSSSLQSKRFTHWAIFSVPKDVFLQM